MHAVIIKVVMNDREAILRALPGVVIPLVQRNPGLIHGYITMRDSTGMGFWLVDSEEHANLMYTEVEARRDKLPPEVTLDSVEVREVVARAEGVMAALAGSVPVVS